MSTNSTVDLDMKELHDAANLVRSVAIRKIDRGEPAQVLNVIADEIMRQLHVLAYANGAKRMSDDATTPTDDRAVMKRDEKPTVENRFIVGELEGTILMTALSPRRLSKDEALNLAAHLLLKADEPVAFDHVNVAGAVLSVEFVELLRAVQLLDEESSKK